MRQDHSEVRQIRQAPHVLIRLAVGAGADEVGAGVRDARPELASSGLDRRRDQFLVAVHQPVDGEDDAAEEPVGVGRVVPRRRALLEVERPGDPERGDEVDPPLLRVAARGGPGQLDRDDAARSIGGLVAAPAAGEDAVLENVERVGDDMRRRPQVESRMERVQLAPAREPFDGLMILGVGFCALP